MERRGYITILSSSIPLLSGCTGLGVDSSREPRTNGDDVSDSEGDDESSDGEEGDSHENNGEPRSGHLMVERKKEPSGVDPVNFEETSVSESSKIEDLINTAVEQGDASEYYRDLEDEIKMLDEIPEEATESGFKYIIYDSKTFEVWAMIEE